MIRQLLIFFDCPQIRWCTDNYEYCFWWWMKRRNEWPNTILSLSRYVTNGAYEEYYGPVLDDLKKKEFRWNLWSNE